MSSRPQPAIEAGVWVKSSHSGGEGNCVEWAPAFAAAHGTVPVRDSKQAHGPVLMVGPRAFRAFVRLARSEA
ncbi:DUF397 domain-containing protein [Streptomyces yaizuensis]|uniref:DUF397 domain-containing protein n=1 Tax=Streptomyces yaizuensis TaxID=2989713 RepID=A0ABQ5PAB9_9ACTN|nr:DUF397 domain-containing protein [Streptomyces sp. YSPA8]GLF99502.1 DUF397 domain-containing protein [Streptomyces sp. YSPA8]